MILKACSISKKINIISCDNIEQNSSNFKKAFKIFCKKKNKKLYNKIDKYLIFSNSMVDRITPGSNYITKNIIKKKFGYTDNCHVESENHIEWIVSKNKRINLPPLHKVGVKYVSNISDYQEMK